MRRTRRVQIPALILGSALALHALGGVALADPATPATLTYHLTDCTGPAGTPLSFDALKQPGGAAALHLIDGGGTFVAMAAIDVATGTTLFSTPGFERNVVPTVTCSVVHPVTNTVQLVTGIITPVR